MEPRCDKYTILGKMLFTLLKNLNETKEKTYTIEEYADAADMEPTELCRYLTGRRRPKLHQVMRLLAVFPAGIADVDTCTEIIRCSGHDISYDYCPENGDYRAIISMSPRTVEKVNKHLYPNGNKCISKILA